jgi:hypothetical protein
MHSIEIPEIKKTLYMPSDLSECDARQYIEMAGLMYQYQIGALSYEDLRVHAVYKLLNLKRKQNPNQAVEEEKLDNILAISKLVDNFFTPTETQMIINQHYINNPVKSFAPAWKRFYGPLDGFQNVKFGEYVAALRIFLEFSANPSYDLLLQLTATLYRPKKSFHFIKKMKTQTVICHQIKCYTLGKGLSVFNAFGSKKLPLRPFISKFKFHNP